MREIGVLAKRKGEIGEENDSFALLLFTLSLSSLRTALAKLLQAPLTSCP